jgi:Phosphate-induced protein 1 conserved region
MIRFVRYSLVFAALSLTCWAQNSRLSLASPPHGVAPKTAVANQISQPNSTYNGIDYHGGPVMNAPHGTNVYFIWYGNWSNDTTPAILTYFIKHLGGTAYFNITSSYYDYNPGGEKDPVVNRVNYGGSITDNYSLGSSLTDNDVGNIVGFAIGDGAPVGYPRLPVDPNGLYLVLTSADVTEQEFCVNFCAWHGYGIDPNTGLDIKVGHIGNSNQCPSACSWQNPSPNNNPAADDAANMVAHEVSETVTDPLLSAWWRTSDGSEMGDLCQWTFGKEKLLPNGSTYNLKFGGRPYHIQRLWVNARGGYCALALDE